MSVNRGKKFEKVVQECFERINDVSIDRIHDQTTGYRGSSNICDFIVYREPNEFYFECKSVHGNTLPFSNITETQWEGLLEKSAIPGVYAGIICWWIDKGVTRFIPIQELQDLKDINVKSIRYDSKFPVDFGNGLYESIEIPAAKKRVFYDYDMEALLNEIAERYQETS